MAARRDDINLWDEMYRRRAALGPLYVAAGSALAATGSTLMDTAPTAAALIAVGGGAAAWIHSTIHDKLRRAYAYAVTGTSAGWILAAHEYFRDYPDWVATALISGTVVLGVPWWASRRRKSQVRMEHTVQDWPRLASRIGLGSSQITNVVMTTHGYEGTIVWPNGTYNVDSVLSNGPGIEGVLGAPRGSVEMDSNGLDPNSARFSVTTRDPHAAPQAWKPPNAVRSFADSMELGPDKRGTVVKVQRYIPKRGTRHVLIAGKSDSGKSSLINLEVAESVCCHDTFTIGFDFKEVELRPWRPALGYFTSEFDYARSFILAMEKVLTERQSIVAERGARIWDTKIDGPIMNIVIDEVREFLGKADQKLLDAFISIANKGRAFGIRFVLATQYPTLEALGSSQIRQQVECSFCFRMKDDDGEMFVMPGHRINAHKIDSDRPGTAYFLNGDKLHQKPIRIFYLDDMAVKAVAAARAGQTSELDSRTDAVLTRELPWWSERDRYYREGDPRATQRDSVEAEAGAGETVSETERDRSGTGARPSRTATETSGTLGGTRPGPVPPTAGPQGEWSETESRSSGTATGSGAGLMDYDTEIGELDLEDVIKFHRDRQSPEERKQRDREREELLASQSTRKPTSAEAEAALKLALVNADHGGVQAKELYQAAGRSQSWLYPKLHEWESKDWVERTLEFGNWRLTRAGREEFGKVTANAE